MFKIGMKTLRARKNMLVIFFISRFTSYRITLPAFASTLGGIVSIITTLLSSTRIQITGRIGEYYTIRSLDTKGIRGYVHKEDAFFGARDKF